MVYRAAGRAGERAGRRAYHRKVEPPTVLERAATLARAYAARHRELTARVQVHVVYSYAKSYVDFYERAAVEAGAVQEAVERSFPY
jgi:hypothetical protein